MFGNTTPQRMSLQGNKIKFEYSKLFFCFSSIRSTYFGRISILCVRSNIIYIKLICLFGWLKGNRLNISNEICNSDVLLSTFICIPSKSSFDFITIFDVILYSRKKSTFSSMNRLHISSHKYEEIWFLELIKINVTCQSLCLNDCLFNSFDEIFFFVNNCNNFIPAENALLVFFRKLEFVAFQWVKRKNQNNSEEKHFFHLFRRNSNNLLCANICELWIAFKRNRQNLLHSRCD